MIFSEKSLTQFQAMGAAILVYMAPKSGSLKTNKTGKSSPVLLCLLFLVVHGVLLLFNNSLLLRFLFEFD